MQNFTYYTPTKVVFGKGAETKAGKMIKQLGCKKVLVHYGGKSAKASGLLDRILDSLTQEEISFVTLGGVQPNPRLSKVYEGIALCKKEGVDFILAVGGGSVIDSAKGIGIGVANDCDVWDIYSRKEKATGCLPIGAVLTIAAAGSEMSESSVLTNEDGWLKRGLTHESLRCRFSLMNPELTYTLPKEQTAYGCVDIMMHTMERYFSQGGPSELTDGIAEALMRTVIRNAKILKEEPQNYDARAEIMWAGSLAHNDLTGCGRAGNGRTGDWATHQLEHELSGIYDVPHGAGLAAMWGSWARYVYRENPERFRQFAVNVMGVADQPDAVEAVALKGIEAVEAFYRQIDMPTSISALGIEVTEAVLDELAHKCSFFETRTIGTFKTLTKTDIRKIYEMAR